MLPVALRFADAATGETSQAPRYIDDDSLVVSLWNTLRAPPLLATRCVLVRAPLALTENTSMNPSPHEA